MRPPADLATPVRDPKKLRRTAWILVAVMIVGGWLVLKAYETWAEKQASDTRPALIHRIRKERDLRVMRQDGRQADLSDLHGRVFVLNVLSLKDPEAANRSMAVMKRLANQRADDGNFRLVTLLIDPVPAEALRSTLATTAETHGMKLPQWWLGSNESATLHRFIKNELKAAVFPNESGGKWHYDPSVFLIDRGGHLRRAVVPKIRNGRPSKPAVVAFDFDIAARWDAEGRKSGTSRSNEAELEDLLGKTIDLLLNEAPEKP